MSRQKNIGLIFKNLGITLAIILSPVLLIALDLIWGIHAGQTTHNDDPPFLNENLFKVIMYAPLFATPLFAFLATKNKKQKTKNSGLELPSP